MIWSTLTHKWLKIPYTLHIHTDRRVKKPRATIVFIHGIGNSGAAWDEITTELPGNLRLITVDLLGFGESKRPPWVIYNAKTQANSLAATLLKLRTRGRVIIVGHSLGSLVAVEIAKRYPLFVKELILCSPPFYRVDIAKKHTIPESDTILRDIYRLAVNHPDQFIKLSKLAARLGLVNKSFNLSTDNADTYMNALEAAIINQTSLEDATKLSVPTQILYGRLDPVVVLKNLRYLTDMNPNVTLKILIATHEIQGANFIKATIAAIRHAIE